MDKEKLLCELEKEKTRYQEILNEKTRKCLYVTELEHYKGARAAMYEAICLAKQLYEPTHEPVEVPSFIGRYIQETKAKRNLKWAMQDILNDLHDDEFNAWFENDSNFEVFAKAWIYGYKEKEPLYVMPVPYAKKYWYYLDEGTPYPLNGKGYGTKFTADEINEYFPEIAEFKEEVAE